MVNSSRRSLAQTVDWKLVICYLLLVLIGWLNIYASSHASEAAGILDFATRSGKQFVWILSGLGLGTLILFLFNPRLWEVISIPSYLIVLVLLVAVIFGSFVFYQITDTDPAHKLTLYVDGEVRNEAQLAALLEKELPEPIRMVQVHPFSYAMFGSDALRAADLYIVPDSEKEQYADWFAPGEEALTVCDPGGTVSVAGSWILYAPGETYRLYIGAYSPHLSDGLARRGARRHGPADAGCRQRFLA